MEADYSINCVSSYFIVMLSEAKHLPRWLIEEMLHFVQHDMASFASTSMKELSLLRIDAVSLCDSVALRGSYEPDQACDTLAAQFS